MSLQRSVATLLTLATFGPLLHKRVPEPSGDILSLLFLLLASAVVLTFRPRRAQPAILESAMFTGDRLGVRMFRRILGLVLRLKGFSNGQVAAIQSKIGDGKILEWIKKYGPTIVAILKIVIPIILMFFQEPPANAPHPDADALIDELLTDTDGDGIPDDQTGQIFDRT